ncbi:hypothetical protein SAMN02746065_11912 [Desulfocicer vacuolatum DSM 3385]|uniref:Uncharacterized protein n=1 Tax=Desulfocicer vacuolatum DSM 3385 TaxID=1121400 RepID=A0A1W2DNK1_9BACT|nr:hypothetical protein SAMN02746065_11912 [Desulfocicer vacuolatum DSM 3385]
MKKRVLGIRFWVFTATIFSLFVVAGAYSHVGLYKNAASKASKLRQSRPLWAIGTGQLSCLQFRSGPHCPSGGRHNTIWLRVYDPIFVVPVRSTRYLKTVSGRLAPRQNQIHYNPEDTCKSNALEGKFTGRKSHAANTKNKNQGNNGKIPGLGEVLTGFHQGI